MNTKPGMIIKCKKEDLDKPQQAVRMSHVGEQLSKYEELQEHLSDTISILHSRLAPITNPAPTSSAAPDKDGSDLVPLAFSIHQLNNKLADSIFRLKDIINSLEL